MSNDKDTAAAPMSYVYSTDYDALYDLAKKGDYIIGRLVFPKHQVSAMVKWNDPVMHIANTVMRDDKGLFIAECTRLKLEFLIPSDPRGLSEQWVNACIGALERALHPVLIHGATSDAEDVRHAIATMRHARDKGFISPSKDREIIQGLVPLVRALVDGTRMPTTGDSSDSSSQEAIHVKRLAHWLTAARDHLLTH